MLFLFAFQSCRACKPILHGGCVNQARLLELKVTTREHSEIRNAAHVVLSCKLWEPFRIHFQHDCAPGEISRRLRHVRRGHAARSAPGRPKIRQNRYLAFADNLLKFLFVDFHGLANRRQLCLACSTFSDIGKVPCWNTIGPPTGRTISNHRHRSILGQPLRPGLPVEQPAQLVYATLRQGRRSLASSDPGSGGDMVRSGILEKETRPRNKAGVVFSILIPLLAAILLFVVIQAKLRGAQLPDFVIFVEAVGFVVVILAGTWFLIRGVREHRESEERYRQMASHIQEIFWMLDAESKRVLEVNEAYETITGRTRRSLLDNPTSYEEIIHPEDRVHVLARLDEATRTGKFDERFRITLPNGDFRWVRVHGFPMRNPAGKIWRLVGTAQDITEQKQAEDQVVKNLEIAESARAEADALRKATLSLTQDLHMDSVMEALLRSLEELVPYTSARVIVPEGGPHLLALGEREIPEQPKALPKYRPGHPLTLIADECPFLKRILEEQKSVLLPDTCGEKDWQTFNGHAHLRSWLSVPLKASDEYLGFLSIGHTEPNRYTQDHLRRAELLAIPAAAAIQNARLYSTADMYGSELQKRLVDLQEAETALAEVQGEHSGSIDKFEKVFRSSPTPFTITTLREGRFIDVNAAFERRYGYSRTEVLGRTVHELHMWCDPADRMFMTEQLRQGVAVRNKITWLRTKSGEIKLTVYSADRIHFDGQPCVLAVSEDLPEFDKRRAN